MTQRLVQAGLCFGAAIICQPAIGQTHRSAHTPPQGVPEAAQPDAVLAKPYGGTAIDVLTYHYDGNRTGWDSTETDLTPASVASKNFVRLAILKVDGNVLAQPLVVSGLTLPDASVHDVLIVATGHNTVYAFDTKTYSVLWQRTLGPAQAFSDVGCRDVIPEYGISSTPVILRPSASRATLYVVSAQEPSKRVFHTYLHALDVGSGQDVTAAREISPSVKLSGGSTLGFDAQNQWSRAGLAASKGGIYVSIGSHCDNNGGGIAGWELRFDPGTLAQTAAFHTVNTPGGTELASIWMTGFAPALDASGDLFVVTGNGDFTKGQNDWGESVLKLSSDLSKVLGRFTPAAYDALNSNDEDLGSGGVMLLPSAAGQSAAPLAVAVGKSSILYLLNQKQPGGEAAGDPGAMQALPAGGNGLWGGPAYYSGPNGPVVYAQTGGDLLRAYGVATSAKPALTQTASGTTNAGYGGSLPVVASHGSADGVVFLERRSQPINLEAYDAAKLGAPLATLAAGSWSNMQNGNSFVAPIVANGRVYAPAYKTVEVFGLRQ